jgi:hypothetical protein
MWTNPFSVPEPIAVLLDQKTHIIREATGVFSRSSDHQNMIDEFLSAEADRAELSLLAGEQAIEGEPDHRARRLMD